MVTRAMASRPFTATNEDVPQYCGVINPYALAEQVSGRKIPWREISNAPQLLADILQTPYDELFDPKFGGPLYLGLKLNDRLELERERSPLLDVELTVDISDLQMPLMTDAEQIQVLGDLGQMFKIEDVAGIEVRQSKVVANDYLQLLVRVPETQRLQRLARVFNKPLLQSVAHDPGESGKTKDWTPENASWSDPGRFFLEAAEFFDPVQGAVANCYYIAALAAVAWAMPYRIRHLTRAIGQSQQQFTNMISFYQPDSNGQLDQEVEVTDAVPINSSSGGFIYARSSEAGEIWPAVYEKAFAKLETGTSGDRPDITATAWGDCVKATAQLTGGRRHYYDTASRSGTALWDLVRANSIQSKTVNPMTCWTYSSSDAAEKKVVYSDANIVASHCYTILGWAYHDGREYLILRNPWGNTEASVGTLNGTVWLYDISWWRPITLTTMDGTFAIEASTFKTYFAGLGVAK